MELQSDEMPFCEIILGANAILEKHKWQKLRVSSSMIRTVKTNLKKYFRVI